MSTDFTKLDRRVRKLLLSTAGRASLRKFGIDVEISKAKEPEEQGPVVSILCPTYRNPEPQMRDALSAMVHYSREKGITVYGGPPVQASVVHWSRNWLISEQIKSGKPWTHVLFIDDDIVIQPDALERLLSHKKDIIAGLCTRRTDPPIPNIRFYDKETGDSRQIWEWPENQLIEVDAVGTGLMLLSRHAVEQVAQVYFDCLWEQDFYGFSGEKLAHQKKIRLDKFDTDKIAYWFRFLPTTKGDIEMGEDICFCYMAKTYCDLGVFVDTSVQPGHLGLYPYSIRDFLPYRNECVKKAKAEGKYQTSEPLEKVLPISILVPTRKRPEMVLQMLKSVQDTAKYAPEVIFYVDEDDDSLPPSLPYFNAKVLRGPRITLSKMWNECAAVASGEILMLAGDDFVFKTPGWDEMVMRAFLAYPDRLIMAHGDDGHWGDKFGTHCFVHRNWIDTVGYFAPPYFSSDFNDTWLNEVANAIGRRVYLPFVNEHIHPYFGKREYDQTDKDRIERHKQDGVEELYKQLQPERQAAAEKLKAAIERHMVPA